MKYLINKDNDKETYTDGGVSIYEYENGSGIGYGYGNEYGYGNGIGNSNGLTDWSIQKLVMDMELNKEAEYELPYR